MPIFFVGGALAILMYIDVHSGGSRAAASKLGIFVHALSLPIFILKAAVEIDKKHRAKKGPTGG